MKIAIVTGASAGLGKEFVRQIEDLYVSLDEIWVIARRAENMARLERELRTPLRIFALDLGKKKSFALLQHTLESNQPDVRMLVNAAGFGKIGRVEDLTASDQVGMIEVNCRALVHMISVCLPYMKSGSRILNLASAAAFCPQPGFSVYAATKAFVLSYSRSLGAEVIPRGIAVTTVCPGPVETEFFEIAGNQELLPVLKKMAMAKPYRVVRRALLDSVKEKEVSVYGKLIKGARFAAKLLPHKFIISIMKPK